ncbi:hypothetical protein ASPFODRAFT_33199 [Aspergillus luchuensis CBS 106.47]|uniref:Uncharacterized protein n=1 Tax=Aspergillus luchuensis (strain CBS 106.47) TaxID=1137211 RepID=A0A1M3TJN7_ASPLC|nr:hypothetical protein ASPFODRAFT_33199 [Aspergillus luchuensis CBS 106.47]
MYISQSRLSLHSPMLAIQVSLTAQDGELLKQLTTVSFNDGISPVTIERFPLPVTEGFPPLVVNNESVCLRDLDLVRVTTRANLPRACQTTYHNIFAQGITLRADDFENLPDVIQGLLGTQKAQKEV